MEWIARFGDGSGPGWTPAVTGRRLIRMIYHGAFILRAHDENVAVPFLTSLGQQATFLSNTWGAMKPGHARFEALTGTIIAGLSLEHFEAIVAPAVKQLAQDCTKHIDKDGAVPTRSPEQLLDIFTLIIWSQQALADAGEDAPDALQEALNRMAPTLRALRHVSGELARLHGGGCGIEGRLDHALADSKVKVAPIDADRLYMDYARLTTGRTSLIVDAAPPPAGPDSVNGHASTLAFELTSGRRPLIVNAGSGNSFGPAWRRSARATAAHSTLSVAGYSSSRLGNVEQDRHKAEYLQSLPETVQCGFSQLDDGKRLELSHDGYRAQVGLTHARVLDLSNDGRSIVGEDYIGALSDKEKSLFRKITRKEKSAASFQISFHLHPDVAVRAEPDGKTATLRLQSGETWVFTHDGLATLSVEPTYYLENGRPKPRDSQQVVLSGIALDYASRVRWSFAKADGTPNTVRDIKPATSTDGHRSSPRGTI